MRHLDPDSEQRDRAVQQLTTLLESQERAFGALHATRAMTLAAMYEAPGVPGQRVSEDAEMMLRSVAAEAAAAVRVSDRTMQRRLWEAWSLVHHFPATFASLAQGKISLAHAVEIQKAAGEIQDDARKAFEERAVPLAEAESVSRLAGMLSVVAEQVRPVGMTERHRAARKARGVFVRELPDGMGELVAVLPAVLAQGCVDRLTALAHSVRSARQGAARERGAASDSAARAFAAGAGSVAPTPAHCPDAEGAGAGSGVGVAGGTDARTMDQLRADVFADLVLSGGALAHGDGLGAIRARVQVTVPIQTLAGIQADGASMAGWGALDADTARTLAAAAPGWDRVMTDRQSGAVVAVDRYRPSQAMVRALGVRDERCRFPGCGQPVWRCDVDHTRDAALGGPTSIDNLAHLCRRHHSLKHVSAWTVTQLGGGLLEWQSPTGRVYVDAPPRTLTFAPTPASAGQETFRPHPGADDPPPW